MASATHPTKEQVREYFEMRVHSSEPPPTSREIREKLGWNLLPDNAQTHDDTESPR